MSKSILIVDDELDLADVVGAALEDEGHRVTVAANGSEGLQRFQEQRPDLIICDLMMPFMDGATMCRQIRSDPAGADVPIMAMSVMDENALKVECVVYDAYLRKPFRRAVLLEAVSALLNRTCPRLGR
ncbi:response regulator [Steroidobacter sp. S1-65]|uniref:Response regulator n=1 Tax=Steroidobacter gossypii TaxID=2805490 RepID=A0ABS1X0I5_9GAMM|nr:response regulator [Steroidobacter gossypii]MBM0106748.1 response regulator [Steroidobacter gossypii]